MIAEVRFADAPPERDGALLVGWLRLLGWRVEIAHVGDQWTGIARRIDGYGQEHVVRGCADSHGDLVSELFQGALCGLALQAAA
jgi:hypothetical protein